MLTAVDLDNELQFHASEIGEVRPDRVLALEVAIEIISPQEIPKPKFGLGGRLSAIPLLFVS
jgi:hypothetical protein